MKMDRDSLKDLAMRYWYIFPLAAIFFIAVYVRMLPIRQVCLDGTPCLQALDPFWVYRMGESILADNFHLPLVDTMRYHPWGVADSAVGFPGALYTPPILFKMLSSVGFGWTFLELARFYSPFMAGIMVLAMFYIGKELYDNLTGLFAAFLLATTPATMYRTAAGFVEKEPIAGAFMMWMLYFFVRTLKRDSWLSAAMMGVCFSASLYAWTGAWAMNYIMLATCFVYLLGNRPTGPIIKIGIMNVLLAQTFTQLLVRGASYDIIGGALALVPISYLGLVGLAFMKDFAPKKGWVKKSDVKYLIPVMTLGLAFFVFVGALFSSTLAGLVTSFKGIFSVTTTGGILSSTVAENNPGTWADVKGQLSLAPAQAIVPQALWGLARLFDLYKLMFLGGIILLFRTLKTHKWEKYFTILWVVATLYGSGPHGRIRVIFLLGPAAALLGGYFFAKVINFLRSSVFEEFAWNTESIKTGKGIVASLLILMLTFGAYVNISSAYAFGGAVTPSMDANWQEAMVYLRDQTPEDSVILSWWDYGYWFQTAGERASIGDGGNMNGTANILLARFFMEQDMDTKLEYLQQVEADYIVVDYTLIGKYSAMSKIGTDGRETHIMYPLRQERIIQADDGPVMVMVYQDQNIILPFYVPVAETGEIRDTIYADINNQLYQVKYGCVGGDRIEFIVNETEPYWDGSCILFHPPYGMYLPLPDSEPATSIFAKLYLGEAKDYDFIEKVFQNANGYVKIFKIDKEKLAESIAELEG